MEDDFVDLRSKEECPVKNDPLDPKSNEEFPGKNELLEFTSEELSRFTSQFSSKNLIGLTYFGKLYRGKMPIASDQDEVTKDVTVKILVDDERNYGFPRHDDELPRLVDELKFLQAPKIRGIPNLVKVVGYCHKEIVGVVYDINPLDTLRNLISQDDFNWLRRVKTALELARLLAYLHDRNQSYLIRNFAPSHIVVDQNFTPVLFEFGMLVGGVLETTVDELDRRLGPFGYNDPCYAYYGPAAYNVKSDVYAFGVSLYNLLSKRAHDKEKYRGCGRKLTELARQCMDDEQKKRPEMKQVFERLKGLRCCAAAVLYC